MLARQPCFTEPDHLVLAGAHHRTGSEMLTRVMGALCKRCWRVSRWKVGPTAPPGAAAAVEAARDLQGGAPPQPPPSPCQVDTESPLPARLNASYSNAGLRLLSSGAWLLDPAVLPRALPPHAAWRMVHLVRDPLDTALSAYHYHQTTDEPWVHVPGPAVRRRPCSRPPLPSRPTLADAHVWCVRLVSLPSQWHTKMGLRPALASPKQTFAQQLRALDRPTGAVLQAQHSLRGAAAMVAVAERCWQTARCLVRRTQRATPGLHSGRTEQLGAARAGKRR